MHTSCTKCIALLCTKHRVCAAFQYVCANDTGGFFFFWMSLTTAEQQGKSLWATVSDVCSEEVILVILVIPGKMLNVPFLSCFLCPQDSPQQQGESHVLQLEPTWQVDSRTDSLTCNSMPTGHSSQGGLLGLL